MLADNASAELNALDDTVRDLNAVVDVAYEFNAIEMIDALSTLHQTMSKEILDIEYIASLDLDEINARLNKFLKGQGKV